MQHKEKYLEKVRICLAFVSYKGNMLIIFYPQEGNDSFRKEFNFQLFHQRVMSKNTAECGGDIRIN